VMLANLAAALQTRFERSGDAADLEESVALLRGAVATTGDTDPQRPVMLANLAAALQTRFERSGDAAGLQESIQLLDIAMAQVPPGHARRSRLTSLVERGHNLRRTAGAG